MNLKEIKGKNHILSLIFYSTIPIWIFFFLKFNAAFLLKSEDLPKLLGITLSFVTASILALAPTAFIIYFLLRLYQGRFYYDENKDLAIFIGAFLFFLLAYFFIHLATIKVHMVHHIPYEFGFKALMLLLIFFSLFRMLFIFFFTTKSRDYKPTNVYIPTPPIPPLRNTLDEVSAVSLGSDRDFVLYSVKKNGLALEFASTLLKNDREIVLIAVTQNGYALEFASADLQNDFDIVLSAVKQNGYAIEFASKQLKTNRDLALAAIIQNCDAIHLVEYPFMDDPEMLASIKENTLQMALASGSLKPDREAMLATVEKNGLLLLYASDDIRSDSEIVLAAVKQNGLSLGLASVSLRVDKTIVIAALSQNAEAIRYVDDSLLSDPDVIAAYKFGSI
jgi:hypothetical protein